MTDSPSGADRVRLASALQSLLLVAAAILALPAVALPTYRLVQSDATATVNLTDAASARALATVGLPTSRVEPTDSNGLTVTLVVTTLESGDPVPWYLRLLSELGTSLWALGLVVQPVGPIAYLALGRRRSG